MKLSKSLRAFAAESSKTDSYWVEQVKLAFSVELERQRRAAKMNYAAIAEKLGTSAAYITKVFRGDSNMTIESMVKLARATGGQLDIRVVGGVAAATRWDIAKIQVSNKVASHSTGPASTIVSIAEYAANHDRFSLYKVAA